jgi:uncharacterized membrane protein
MNIAKIKNELRESESDDMGRRRKIIFLSAVGLVDFSIISLYQTGVIKNLPDIPLCIFDSNKVNASDAAYQFGVPDGPVSSLAYSAIMVLASAGANDSSQLKPALDLALGTIIAANAAGAIFYLNDMLFKQRKICVYCITGAIINFASAIIIAPVILKSLKKIFR